MGVTGDQLPKAIRSHGTRADKKRAALHPHKARLSGAASAALLQPCGDHYREGFITVVYELGMPEETVDAIAFYEFPSLSHQNS
jgi:hypothetical protein